LSFPASSAADFGLPRFVLPKIEGFTVYFSAQFAKMTNFWCKRHQNMI